MKFTKDDAFKSLEGYLTDNGRKPLLLSKRSVEKQIEALMPLLAGEETELSAFVEQVRSTFETMQDNLRYDNSQFVKKWEKDHPQDAAAQEPAQNSKPTEEGSQQRDDVIRQLQDRLDKMEKEAAERQKAGAVAAKREAIAKAMDAKGVKDTAWVSDFLGEVAIGEDTDVEATAEKYLKIYNKGRAGGIVPGVVPGGAGAGTATGGVPASLQEAAKLMAERNGAKRAEVSR